MLTKTLRQCGTYRHFLGSCTASSSLLESPQSLCRVLRDHLKVSYSDSHQNRVVPEAKRTCRNEEIMKTAVLTYIPP